MNRFTLRPVSGELFIGREELLNTLIGELSRMDSAEGFCIYGRRRIGKTSLLKELERRLRMYDRVVPVYFSFWEVGTLSLKDLVERLSDAIIAAYQEKGLLKVELSIRKVLGSTKETIARVVSKTKVQVKIEEVEFLLSMRERPPRDYVPVFRKVFDMAEKLAEKTETKCVLLLDEFPEILRIENGLQIVKMLRTAYEDYSHTALVISGSVRKTMKLVVLSEAAPFYRQLLIKRIQPLTREEVLQFLKKYTGVEDKRTAEELYRVTGGVPFYLQWLGRVGGLRKVEEAVEEFIEEEGNVIFQEEFSKLSGTERRVIVALAKGKERPAEISREAGIEINATSAYLKGLIDKEIVEKVEKGRYRLRDRLFERWVLTVIIEKSLSEKVLDALIEPLSLQELYKLFPEHTKAGIRSTVYRLVNKGLVKRVEKGRYVRL